MEYLKIPKEAIENDEIFFLHNNRLFICETMNKVDITSQAITLGGTLNSDEVAVRELKLNEIPKIFSG